MPGWDSPARPAVYKAPIGAQVASPQSPILRWSTSRISALTLGTRGAKQKSGFARTSGFANYKVSGFANYRCPVLLAPRQENSQPVRENPPYGMNRGGGGKVGRTRGLFATMLERADTKEAIGLNRSRLRSTRPVVLWQVPYAILVCSLAVTRGAKPAGHRFVRPWMATPDASSQHPEVLTPSSGLPATP